MISVSAFGCKAKCACIRGLQVFSLSREKCTPWDSSKVFLKALQRTPKRCESSRAPTSDEPEISRDSM